METKGRLNELSQKYFGQDSILAGVSPDASKAPVSSTTSAPESVKTVKKDPSMKDLDMEILGYTKDDTSILKKSASPSTALATPVGAEKTDVESEAEMIISQQGEAPQRPDVSTINAVTGKLDARMYDPNNWKYQGSGKTLDIPDTQREDIKKKLDASIRDWDLNVKLSPEETKLVTGDQQLWDHFKDAMYAVSPKANVNMAAAEQGLSERIAGDVGGIRDFVKSAWNDPLEAVKKTGRGMVASYDSAAQDLGTYAGDTSVSGAFKQAAAVPWAILKGAIDASGLKNFANPPSGIDNPNAAYEMGKGMNMVDPLMTIATAGAGKVIGATGAGKKAIELAGKAKEKGKNLTRDVLGSTGTTSSILLDKAGLTTPRNIVDFLSNVVIKNTKNARLNTKIKQAKAAFDATNNEYRGLIDVFDAERKKPEMLTSKFKDVVENDSISKIDGSIDTAQFSSKMDDIMKNLKDKGVINKATAEKTLAAEQGRAAQFGTIEEYKADLSERMATLRTSANKRFYDDILSTLNEKQAVAKQLSPESVKLKNDFAEVYKDFNKSATDIEAENFAKKQAKDLVNAGDFVEYNNRLKDLETDKLLNARVSEMIKDKYYTETLKSKGSADIYGGVKELNKKVKKRMDQVKDKMIEEGIYDDNMKNTLDKIMKGETVTLSENGLLERALSNPGVSKVLELAVQDMLTSEELMD